MKPQSDERPLRPGGDDKRARILAAARAVCARTGYEAATMDAVAAEAHVSKGTLYNFFESKEHLFLSTVLKAYDETEATVNAHTGPAEDPHARLDGLIAALVETFPVVAEGMMVNLQVWAVVARDATARARMFDDLRGRYLRLDGELAAALRAGQRTGVFRSDFDADTLARGLYAIHDGFVYRSVFDPDHADASAVRAALEALIRDHVLLREEGSR